VDFEALFRDDNSFNEESKDRLPGVEVGVVELGPERVDELRCAVRAIVYQLRLKLLGLELSERVLGGESAVFESIHPAPKDLKG
jgi:hypothetical protein